MGVDMHGYIYKGPIHLSEDADKPALEQISKIRRCVERYQELCRDGEDVTEERLREEFRQVYEYADDLWFSELGPLIKGLTDEQILAKFKDFWQYPHARDTCFRYYDKEQVVFAGSETWGDEPDGVGYTTLKLATHLNILHLYGIE